MEAHASVFAELLPHILDGDGLSNVQVIVPPETVLPDRNKEAA
jgi:hypothetical protein